MQLMNIKMEVTTNYEMSEKIYYLLLCSNSVGYHFSTKPCDYLKVTRHTRCGHKNKGSPRPARNIRSGGDDDNFAQVSRELRQRDSRGHPHQRVSFVVAFATMYSSSDEEEALLFLVLEDEENSRFVFLSDRCSRSYIIFPP
jgi:hypothetical protein